MGRYSTYTAWLPSSGQSYLFYGLTSTSIATGTIQSLETRAEDLVHGYLAKQYSIPLTATIGTIKTIIEDLVTYDLYMLLWPGEGQRYSVRDTSGQQIEIRYKQAMARITDISTGKADLFDSAGNRVAKSNLLDKIYFNNRNYSPTFNVDDPLNWGVSGNRLDDISSSRSGDTT